jgi:hypothetical protein
LAIGKAGFPRLAFNSLATDSERSEHTGLMNLIKGLFGAFRTQVRTFLRFIGTLQSKMRWIF